ncbi:MAG: CDP-diacylglycerol--glycerol-3-phosphate 3-phosphatidyltransferase [Calditrichaceae bacterium]|nr:CDP-diacylglycerol--glycerol-3-phosphate 3-phosphatidyltransferase [Calditrichaceae bacterium]MBN2710002.1 CDP-diacylglycerol--glycerol-3-phosphate 3-phosphatidyltransferase [Calditrichaceae bacterium]RQV97339.1 MAG: CDP-diacylglycerol--glycerol-3-phosphate 3-phosphatidyltransferase [Calditrichota bacterium]
MVFIVPNQLTLIRILLTPVFIWLFLHPGNNYHLAAGIVFLIGSLTDWYDGFIARRFNLISRWGQFMDPLADKILVSSALVVFALKDYVFWWMIIIIIFRDFLITFLRSFALIIGKPIITTNFAKWKTFLQMTFVFLVLIYINIPGWSDLALSTLENPWLHWTTILVLIVVILTVYSGIHYIIVNFVHIIELYRRMLRLIGKRKKSDLNS